MTERTGKPLCSICIANFNGEGMLDECLASVFAQQGNFDLEVIVHDDASTDSSLTILARFPEVIVLASKENVGFCIANNRMVAKAGGEYVLLLNNDAALFPGALQVLLDEARALGADCVLSVPQYDWHSGELVDLGSRFDPFYNPIPNLESSRTDIAMVTGACLFIPRRLWLELGGFPEWMGSFAEDAYLCCRARLLGAPVKVAARSGYRHRQGGSFGGSRITAGKLNTTFRRRFLSERNKTSVMVICTPSLWAWPLLGLHFALLLLEGAVLAVLKRDTRIWREIYGPVLRHILEVPRRLLPLRRSAQRTRRISLRAYLRGFTWLPRKFVLLSRHGLPKLG